ncbi:hypothetical protein BC332_34832 [Capsicum chinense]|nr:hypothetical protein BC332_34832 [Capsicum chinense]
MSAARPRSFLSPLQLSVAVLIYKKYGSKRLIDVLESLSVCSSYHEAKKFEVSSIMRTPLEIDQNSFSQFIFDNADFNTQTIDGLQTFHAMGGVQCITPRKAIPPDQIIERINKIPLAKELAERGVTRVEIFEKKSNIGLQDMKIIPLKDIQTISESNPLSFHDILWLYGKYAGIEQVSGWNGFMEKVTAKKPFQVSFVSCLPFINAPATEYDTIFTALVSASKKSRALNQGTCFVTFDLPLYMKAQDILANCDASADLGNWLKRGLQHRVC